MLAIKGGYAIEQLFYFPELISASQISQLAPGVPVTEINREVFEKVAYRDSTEGVIAIAKAKTLALDDLKLSANPLILVAEAPEKPGNLGALLRTADAAGLDAVVVANAKSDLYSPNVIRSSVGCLFTMQVATGSTDEVIDYLNARGIHFYAATLQNATVYDTQDYTRPTAMVVGTEDEGLTQRWRDAATSNVIIPMMGQIDSMNVSVAAAILIFEARRQRGFA